MKPPRRNARKTKGPQPKPPSATEQGRFEILLEDIKSQNRMTTRAVMALDTRLTRQMQELEHRLAGQISALQSVVRENSADVRKNSEDIARLADELNRMPVVAGKADIAPVESLDRRVLALERVP